MNGLATKSGTLTDRAIRQLTNEIIETITAKGTAGERWNVLYRLRQRKQRQCDFLRVYPTTAQARGLDRISSDIHAGRMSAYAEHLTAAEDESDIGERFDGLG